MKQRNIKAKSGFTIIEVVLVLAIAGLIFLMVFVALPALQRSQRDTQRRDDMARVDTALNQYQTNNSTRSNNLPGANNPKTAIKCELEGKGDTMDLPSGEACDFIKNYMNKSGSNVNTFIDPDGNPYSLDIANIDVTIKKDGTVPGDFPNGHTVYIVKNAKCEGENVSKTDSVRDYAILYRLEGSGVSCTDSQ